MKRLSKLWVFIVAILIFALTFTAFFGVENYYGDKHLVYFKSANDIRWGIDIQGGVEAVFSPENVNTAKVTQKQLESAKEIIDKRLINKGITDYETSVDMANKQIIVRFPWQAGEQDYDAASAIGELGNTAVLEFCGGSTYDKNNVLLSGSDVASASAEVRDGAPYVKLDLTNSGRSKFASATKKYLNQQIAICMDGMVISAPTVNDVIPNGEATITGPDYDGCVELANTINAGSLPFKLTVDDSKLQVISATLGNEALSAMLIAGIIAFAAICILMIARYRLPGAVASIALAGQVAGMVACCSGFFPDANGFTLTIPGLAGMILSIGMGVDANVITAERITEEMRAGRPISNAIKTGHKHAMSAIIDGNITNVLVAIVLMGCFGPSDNIFAKIFSPVIGMFGASVSGAVYSFGYTLLMGVIFNFIMAVFASEIMLSSLAKFKCMRKPWLYGGVKNAEE